MAFIMRLRWLAADTIRVELNECLWIVALFETCRGEIIEIN